MKLRRINERLQSEIEQLKRRGGAAFSGAVVQQFESKVTSDSPEPASAVEKAPAQLRATAIQVREERPATIDCVYYLPLILLSFAMQDRYSGPTAIAEVRIPELDESSGLAASRRHPGIFWSHNDSGGGRWLWAFDRTGAAKGRWRVIDATNSDWEDISLGPGPRRGISYLYIADIGDNGRRRKSVTVYRIPEPDPDTPSGDTAPAERIILKYPDGAHDSEAMMVHPKTGDLYLVTKMRGSDRDTVIWKTPAPLKPGKVHTLRKAGIIRLPESLLSLLIPPGITGGDISPDGTRVALVDYVKAWEAVLPRNAKEFDEIWKAEWQPIETGPRAQGEAIAYRHDGRALLLTSEGSPFPVIEIVRAGQAP